MASCLELAPQARPHRVPPLDFGRQPAAGRRRRAKEAAARAAMIKASLMRVHCRLLPAFEPGASVEHASAATILAWYRAVIKSRTPEGGIATIRPLSAKIAVTTVFRYRGSGTMRRFAL